MSRIVPKIPITDPRFRYVPASHSDIAATFRRIRREQAQKPIAQVTQLKKVAK